MAASFIAFSPDGREIGVLASRGVTASPGGGSELWSVENREGARPRFVGECWSRNFAWAQSPGEVFAAQASGSGFRLAKFCPSDRPVMASAAFELAIPGAVSVSERGVCQLVGRLRSGRSILLTWRPGEEQLRQFEAPAGLDLALDVPAAQPESRGRIALISADRTWLVGLDPRNSSWWLGCASEGTTTDEDSRPWAWRDAGLPAARKEAASWHGFATRFVGDGQGRGIALYDHVHPGSESHGGIPLTDFIPVDLSATTYSAWGALAPPLFTRGWFSYSRDRVTALFGYDPNSPLTTHRQGREIRTSLIAIDLHGNLIFDMVLREGRRVGPGDAALSPDGEQIATVLERGGRVGIAVVGLDGGIRRFWPL